MSYLSMHAVIVMLELQLQFASQLRKGPQRTTRDDFQIQMCCLVCVVM